MTRRTSRAGVLLLAGVLLGSFAFAGGAAGQENERLKVDFRESDPAPGKLGVTVAMSGTAWGSGQGLGPDAFSATINGDPVKIIGANPLGEQPGGTRTQLAIVLVVDTSGSMAGEKIVRARAAADEFARLMKPGTRLGLVAFSDEPRVVQNLTTDHHRFGQPSAPRRGRHALNDAIVEASGCSPGSRASATWSCCPTEGRRSRQLPAPSGRPRTPRCSSTPSA
jgi:hypothetical protein